MTTIEEALHGYLASRDAITAIVGSRIRTQHAEQSIEKPYLIIELGGSKDSYHAAGSSGKAQSFMDVRCVAQRYEESRRLAEIVKTECGGFRGNWSGLAVDSCLPVNLRPEFVVPISGDEQGFQTVVVEMAVWHDVEVPER